MSLITRLQRWRRDDWIIPCAIKDGSGSPVDLTGYTMGGEFTPAGYTVFSDLTIANGNVQAFNPKAGTFTIVVPRTLTKAAPIDVDPASVLPSRVQIYYLDTLLRRQTIGVVGFQVFDASAPTIIDENAGLTLVWQNANFTIQLGLAQGPAGPSSIATAQITDAGQVGAQILEAGSASVVRALIGSPLIGATDVVDQDYAMTNADVLVRVQKLTAARTLTLPSPAQFPKGQVLKIADMTGNASPNTPINVTAPSGASIAGATTFQMVSAYQLVALEHNSKDTWVL